MANCEFGFLVLSFGPSYLVARQASLQPRPRPKSKDAGCTVPRRAPDGRETGITAHSAGPCDRFDRSVCLDAFDLESFVWGDHEGSADLRNGGPAAGIGGTDRLLRSGMARHES